MSITNRAEGSIDDSGEACAESNSNELVLHPRQQPTHVFSNISASDYSRQHIGDVYNTTNFNFADSGDAETKAVIDSLYFPALEKRRDDIGRPASHTYEWLLRSVAPPVKPGAEAQELIEAMNALSIHEAKNDEAEAGNRLKIRREAAWRITDWLRTGTGIFWIVGKGASGKSTLMKYLRNDERVAQLLCEWAADHPIVVAHHFFWSAGSDLQKSHEGLYRSSLWQIFRIRPQLVRIAWQRCSNPIHLVSLPSETDFHEAIANLSAHGLYLCLFVDG